MSIAAACFSIYAFQELKEVYEIEPDFGQKVEAAVTVALQQLGQRGDA